MSENPEAMAPETSVAAEPQAPIPAVEAGEGQPARPSLDVEEIERRVLERVRAEQEVERQRLALEMERAMLQRQATQQQYQPEDELDPVVAKRISALEERLEMQAVQSQIAADDARLRSDPNRYPGYDSDACLRLMREEYAKTGLKLMPEQAYHLRVGREQERIRREEADRLRRAQVAEAAQNRATLPVASAPAAAPAPASREFTRDQIRDMPMSEYERLTRQEGFVRGPDGGLIRRG